MDRPFDKWYFRYLPMAVILVHAYMAWAFAEERIMNTDCSLQFFSSLNDRSFFFQESRYGVFPTQIPLVLGIHLQLPMKWLVVIYSLSFPLLYGTIVWIAQVVLRSMEAALATAATVFTGWAATFFHCTTETHLLLAASALLYGTYQAFGREAHGPKRWGVPLLVALWCLTIHPNALFTVGFVTGLAWINGLVSFRAALPPLALATTYTLAAMGLAEKGSYDANQYETLMNGLDHIRHIADLGAVWFLKEWVGGQYLVPLVMWAMVVLVSRHWRLAGYVTLCIAGFVLITILTFPNGDSLAMMEKSYMPALFMIVLTFCTMLPRIRYRCLPWVIVCAGVIHSVYDIGVASQRYSERLAIMRSLLEGPGRETPKMALLKEPFIHTFLVENNWALSLDAMVMSRCMGPTAKTIFMDDKADRVIKEMSGDASFLYTTWDPSGMELKNPYYFNLPAGPYVLVHGY
jgi:hypothetical protein